MNIRRLWAAMLSVFAAVAISACEKEGPVERTGEEVDEAVDTIKRGGEESTENKVDDAIDEARDEARDAAPNE